MKLKLDPAWQEVALRAEGFLSNRGTTAWATGGFLRDALLGRPTRDLDITIDGDPLAAGPDLARSLGARFVVLDEERRHTRLVRSSLPGGVDITPLRADTIEEDLRLRDYTIDALAAPLAAVAHGSHEVIDPTGGIADLHAGIVRATSEGALRDDPLRLLRGVRIANELGFRLDDETAGMIKRHSPLIGLSAAERKRDELTRIFNAPLAAPGVRLLDEVGLFAHLFPEMEPARGFEQPKEHAFDVLEHSFATLHFLDVLLADSRPREKLEAGLWQALTDGLSWDGTREYLQQFVAPGMTRRGLIKLCGLLHDIGKPQTRTFDPDGRMRFFGHGEVGAVLAGRLLRRLRFSRREIGIVRAMIEAHLRPVQLGQSPGGRPSRRAVYKFFRDTGEAGIDTLFLSLSDHLGSAGPRISLDGFRRHVALTAYILEVRFSQEEAAAEPRLVTGDDLCEALGIQPSPLVGQLIEVVREARAAGEVETREEALALARRLLPVEPDTSA